MSNPYIDSIKQNQNKTQSSSVSSNRYIRSLTTPQQETVQPKRKATPQQTEQLFSRYGIKKPVKRTPSEQFSDPFKQVSAPKFKIKNPVLDSAVKFGAGAAITTGQLISGATDFLWRLSKQRY